MPVGSAICLIDMDIEVRHLRAFVALARHRSYTHAAAELLITQPALSRTIQQLESTLAVRLVERSSHRIALTPAGEAFLLRARQLLGGLEEAIAEASGRRALRLGFSWLLPDPWAQAAIARFEEQTSATVELVRSDDPAQALRLASADIVLVRGGTRVPGASVTHLFDEARVAAVSVRSALADRTDLHWHEFRDLPLVVNTVSGTTGPGSWEPEQRPRTLVTCGNYDAWLELVAADRGVGVVPAIAARRSGHSTIRYLPIRDAPEVPVCLAYPGHTPKTLVRAFLRAAAAAVEEAGSGERRNGDRRGDRRG